MNDLDTFETRLLHELRDHVAARTPVRRSRRPLFLAAAGVVAVAAVGTTWLLPRGSSPLAPAPASASAVLNDAARAAAQAPATHGTYWEVSTLESWPGGHLDEQVWQRKDGRTWFRDNAGALTHDDNGNKFVLCDKAVDFAALTALPTEPAALGSALRQAMLHGDDGPVPASAQDSFATQCTLQLMAMPVTPDVRTAAFRLLAGHPGTQDLGDATDSRGRHGTKLRFTDQEVTTDAIIDPTTGTVLEYFQDDGTKQHVVTVVSAGWTDTLG